MVIKKKNINIKFCYENIFFYKTVKYAELKFIKIIKNITVDLNNYYKLFDIKIFYLSNFHFIQIYNKFFSHKNNKDIITIRYSEKKLFFGEIFINIQAIFSIYIKDNCRIKSEFFNIKKKITFLQFVQFYIIHSILHLNNFDHKTVEDSKRMAFYEKKYYKSFKLF